MAFSAVIYSLIGINILVFLAVNCVPIYWTQEEMFWQGFFWSMDGIEKFTLHLGFHPADFTKPFIPNFVDGAFRTREVSYFLEMAAFKFWQFFGQVLFRNYTLILLHLLNAVLVWFLVVRLTRHKESAWVAALLALNSGVALATLLFPFRNAKILAVTFFLMAWLVAAVSKEKFWQTPFSARAGFFVLVLLGLFTDETSFFLVMLLGIVIALRDGLRSLLHPRVFLGFILCTLVYYSLSAWFLSYAHSFHYHFDAAVQQNALRATWRYWTAAPWASLCDVTKAFSMYFLRRNFGHWDASFAGICAALSAAGLLLCVLLSRRGGNTQSRPVIAIAAVIMLKAILLPHNAGLHNEAFMPSGTVFPSLFFFSYYYVYADALLLALGLGFLLDKTAGNKKIYIVVLILITIINISNGVHLNKGPEDALRFHNLWAPYRQAIGQNVLGVERYLSNPATRPVYAAFPTGDSALFKGRYGDPMPLHNGINNSVCLNSSSTPLCVSFKDAMYGMYDHYFAVRYLRDVKTGRMIVPLENTAPLSPYSGQELARARTFYDAPKGRAYDLRPLHALGLGSSEVSDSGRIKSMRLGPKDSEIIFFIKGPAEFIVSIDGKAFGDRQSYGQSYEMFRFNLKDAITASAVVNLVIKAKPGTTAKLVGPFIL